LTVVLDFFFPVYSRYSYRPRHV